VTVDPGANARRPQLPGFERGRQCVSAHSCKILFTQILGGMSSMPSRSLALEICR
jgi:hypothetical protein